LVVEMVMLKAVAVVQALRPQSPVLAYFTQEGAVAQEQLMEPLLLTAVVLVADLKVLEVVPAQQTAGAVVGLDGEELLVVPGA
jgi:hypothetical protein